ncbi:galactitol-1-phosphate dehydrogenase [Aggregatibacter actinomycetemcomitans serotype e str. SC1083]|uniref:Galactitol-1-phosphate dehydrogenase n=1 Tax=Aggregatibacter actinomycetemcomitans serotype e str. SC1083 TaxID=907488 RepID=G4A7K7_AGGAC|nr:galactitol-1-phosphate 5-dehydrogenase [Aggregatibacter actinomycetemcomitans]EGY34411.1 galactitol-1-phosphate dehydrogenase [Aggregatibacter actinomycetemcomitans serotype e str. SC1083]KYK78629.1 galactitol-1-phosphate 5-dehydrogenase [Aggregatibacter actinomycetemcomitans serotype e str. SC936]KYK93843.1 galactitol-1-phosphate 5-dehydrogenase [Aggregatibacter actinomycetemcomitans serotype e str. ANH9776]TYB22158.1 galactitol-1-phosphate 5-dehydrogenase [Aggregatibacter actinomycetemcomi
MKAVVVEENRKLVLAEIATPKIEDEEDVLVKVLYSGVCGSDIPRIFHHGTHFYPIVLGHEFCGTVEEIGKGVTEFRKGDLVVCAPLQPCFDCEECRKGYYSLCKNYNFIGSRRFGANAEYIGVNKKNLVKVSPDSNPLHDAFIEPITVGLHAINLAQGCADKNVIVIGAGTIGLLAAQCAAALDAKSVKVIDINDEKLALAKELGATQTFNSRELAAEEIEKQLFDSRFDQLVLETAGVPQTVELAIKIAGPRAQVALVGTLHNDLTLNQKVFGLILRKELSILGSWMNYSAPWPGDEWTKAIELVKQGKIQFDKLTASVNFIEDYITEVEKLDGKPMNGKIVLKFQ